MILKEKNNNYFLGIIVITFFLFFNISSLLEEYSFEGLKNIDDSINVLIPSAILILLMLFTIFKIIINNKKIILDNSYIKIMKKDKILQKIDLSDILIINIFEDTIHSKGSDNKYKSSFIYDISIIKKDKSQFFLHKTKDFKLVVNFKNYVKENYKDIEYRDNFSTDTNLKTVIDTIKEYKENKDVFLKKQENIKLEAEKNFFYSYLKVDNKSEDLKLKPKTDFSIILVIFSIAFVFVGINQKEYLALLIGIIGIVITIYILLKKDFILFSNSKICFYISNDLKYEINYNDIIELKVIEKNDFEGKEYKTFSTIKIKYKNNESEIKEINIFKGKDKVEAEDLLNKINKLIN